MLKINSAIMDLFYPVGTYYETSNVDFDPNVAWGGTWVLDSQGKVTVSQDTTDSDFDTLGETGGEKTHTLTVDEMPKHTHKVYYYINKNLQGGVDHLLAFGSPNSQGLSSFEAANWIGEKGGDQAHNNLQPYVVVKRWHRTA